MEKLKMDIVTRLTEKMNNKNLNKMELARISGIKKSTVYNIFNGKYNIKLETLRPIAKALDTTLDYLITGREQQYQPHTLTDDEKYLLALYNELAESSQKLCISSVEGNVFKNRWKVKKMYTFYFNVYSVVRCSIQLSHGYNEVIIGLDKDYVKQKQISTLI